MSVASREIVLVARRSVRCAPEAVFEHLADLRRHWPLLDGDLVRARMLDGGQNGAALELRAPVIPVRRRVITRVVYVEAPTLLAGRAEAGTSAARIEWRVQPCAAGSLVTFSAVVEPGNLRDALLATVARPWLARRARRVLRRLAERLEGADR